jgi:hypothetical protein
MILFKILLLFYLYKKKMKHYFVNNKTKLIIIDLKK